MLGLVQRKPAGTRLAELSGMVFEYKRDGLDCRLEVVGFEGFARSYAVWRCRCKCGKIVLRRAGHLLYAVKPEAKLSLSNRRSMLSCGCMNTKLAAGGKSGTREYGYWRYLRACGRLCPEWAASFQAFSVCFESRAGRKRLVRRDTSRPFGPDNYGWSDHTESRLVLDRRAYAVMIKNGDSTAEAMRRIDSISRQAKYQIIWRDQRKAG